MVRLPDLIDIFLQPGEYFVADAGYQIRTMLGSCVSITLWHPKARIGAMSHFLLPSRHLGEYRSPLDLATATRPRLAHLEHLPPCSAHHRLGEGAPQALDARYADEALWLMLRELSQQGVPARECQAKVFGGGNMFPGQFRAGALHIGRRNGEAARALLQAHGIPIMSESLFGAGHRQIIFDVSTGDVWSHQVRPTPPPAPPVPTAPHR